MSHKSIARLNTSQVIEMYLGGHSTIQLSEIFSSSETVIKLILKENDIPRRVGHLIRGFKKRKHSINKNYFSVPNIENSYWAGFIAADGCIDSEKGRVRIALNSKDLHHLKLFRDAIGSSHPIGYRNGYDTFSLEFVCWNFVEDLEKWYNITPRKSLTLCPPNIKDIEHVVSYCIGYIDGDGCIGIDKKGNLYFAVVGTEKVLEYIKEIILQFNSKLSMSIRCRGNYFTMSASCNPIKYALTQMGKYVDVPMLSRKWTCLSL